MTVSTVHRSVLDYVAAWNAADETVRRELLERCFAEDGRYVDPAHSLDGREALLTHSRRFAERWPGSSIVLTSRIDEHDGVACFTWRVVGADGTPLRDGIDFVAVDADGLLRDVHGFFGTYRSPYPEQQP